MTKVPSGSEPLHTRMSQEVCFLASNQYELGANREYLRSRGTKKNVTKTGSETDDKII